LFPPSISIPKQMSQFIRLHSDCKLLTTVPYNILKRLSAEIPGSNPCVLQAHSKNTLQWLSATSEKQVS